MNAQIILKPGTWTNISRYDRNVGRKSNECFVNKHVTVYYVRSILLTVECPGKRDMQQLLSLGYRLKKDFFLLEIDKWTPNPWCVMKILFAVYSLQSTLIYKGRQTWNTVESILLKPTSVHVHATTCPEAHWFHHIQLTLTFSPPACHSPARMLVFISTSCALGTSNPTFYFILLIWPMRFRVL